ncbi:endolytic transglycosylase MltG [Dokdonia donghaensis]|uniref:Endolytic murein transglycosylase n=1 Tax=Dokdonia donghaensis DSW-1 TaxID=1300343 RepID=A0A0A2GSY2_9FLAO|nr:endolytic transglycosylase MltG [Dokdonia donghaensis]ANH61419.1 putative aminodeoxychorismate lyase [Dokdonia donghaensis DSW-1]KGO05401.1 aminodeoxychorismate lyase [Dokdonia donghaensis DSW-1]
MYIKRILLIIGIVGVVVGGIFAYTVYDAIFSDNTAFNNERAHLYIPTGADFNDVTAELTPLLKDVDAFASVAQKKGYVTNVKPGHYIIKKGMSNNDIINTIRIKNTPVKVAFNNQERLEDMAGRIATQIEADSTSLINAMLDVNFLREHDFNKDTALTMYIPNSYEFFWNTSAEDFRARMLSEHKKFWNKTRRAKADKLNLTPAEVYSLASIVQKETAKTDERPRVAGVYLNRLKKGIKLDADPTVIYAVKRTKNDWDMVIKRVLYKDLETDSPYNTYRNRGIPPGPIFMPDVTAIQAVLNPEKHNYYYFVADVENFGYHKFAKTLSQHNANSAAYRRWINSKKIHR